MATLSNRPLGGYYEVAGVCLIINHSNYGIVRFCYKGVGAIGYW